ncbi:MAG: SpoIVB peptidase [Firmicutes bacterium]|jgi:stage IV sporulation protein B|nr:SpoIVB peptidase [Bacillota bacterium]
MKTTTKKGFMKSGFIFLITLLIIGGIGFGSKYMGESQEAMKVVSERVLIPGGQSVGIQMNVRGVLVVGLEEIETETGIVSPGYLAGLQIGDMILSINDQPVYYAGDVEKIVNQAKGKLHLQIQRKDEKMEFTLKPVKSYEDNTYKIGLWVKERIAGIGTLTFYDPSTGIFATLGHGIYESQTGTLLEVDKGELLHTEVKSIQEGSAGKPGEIRGIFYGSEPPLGKVKLNSQYGIYALSQENNILDGIEPMVMATQDQIEEGPATILTTIDGNQVEAFEIEIEKVNQQDEIAGKGLEIKVTDKRLLSYSGGIVQGMSGSPIIQNNRIVGAVTHVLVNNPTKGYGIFAEWMVEEGEKALKLY